MDAERIDVAALRERLGWSQQQLADHCDTDRSTVSKWETDPPRKGPALILLRQLVRQVEAQGSQVVATADDALGAGEAA